MLELPVALYTDLLPFKVKPWAHQLKSISRAVGRDHFAYMYQPGCGKTLAACVTLRNKWHRAGGLQPTLVVTVPIVIKNWQNEFLMHTDLPKERIVLLMGTGKQRLATFKAAQAKYSGRFVAVVNFEGLLMAPLFEALLAWAPPCFVVDESHRIKDPSAKRTKLCIALADRADMCRLTLTGTPVLNSPLDLFSQFRVLDRGAALGKNYHVFRSNYFVDKNAYMSRQSYWPDWRPTKEGMERLNKILQENGDVVEKQSCLDLPPLVRKVIEVELSAEQRKLYDAMKQDFVAYVNDKACVAQLAITKALRLQQIVSGHVPLEGEQGEQSVKSLDDTPREAALKELLQEIAPYHKVLVWSHFRHCYATIRRVCGELGIQYVEINGDTPPKERQVALDRLENDPDVRVMSGHALSAGIGANMTAASYSIYFSRSFSLEADLQSEARNYRGGSERHKSITRIDLVAKNTIDETVLAALQAKTQMSVELLRQEFQGG